jgi:hypothetical protein
MKRKMLFLVDNFLAVLVRVTNVLKWRSSSKSNTRLRNYFSYLVNHIRRLNFVGEESADKINVRVGGCMRNK